MRSLDFNVSSASGHLPGGEKTWLVQFVSAVYFPAGTLVLTSIMLVSCHGHRSGGLDIRYLYHVRS